MDIIPQNSHSTNFIAALTIFQHRRDMAIGLTHITTRQRGLIWYYNTILSQHLKNAALYGALKGIQKQMAEIMVEAQSASLDRQRQLLLEAMALQEKMGKWQRQISNT